MTLMPTLRRSVLLISLLALSACNVVGKGNKMETLEIRDSILGRAIPGNAISLSQCLRYNFEALATFTDGSAGVYTTRAKWTSSDPTVARVSNGDIQLPSDATQAYAIGTVIPVGSGTATITVDYVGKKASMTVTVGAVPSVAIHALSTASPRSTTANPSLTIAPRTVQSYVALATLNGRVTDITSAAKWSVQNTVAPSATTCTNANTANLTCDPVEFVAGSTSSFRAKRLDDSTNPISPANTTQKFIQADFNSIAGMASCPVPSVSLSVANFDATNPLTVTSEYDPNPDPLIEGTTDRVKVVANLRDASSTVFMQDISELASFSDGTTTTMGLGFPIKTDAQPNDASGLYKVVTSPGGANTTIDQPGLKTITDCRAADLTVFAFTLTGLSNLIYAVPSTNAAVTSDTRNFYAVFNTVPAVNTTTAVNVACPAGSTPATTTAVTTDAVTVRSGVFTRQWRSGTLTSITLSGGGTPLKAPQFPQYSEDGARTQLKAVGTFTVPGGSGSTTQDITRNVTWTTSDSSIIGIINGSLSPTQAGQAVASQAGSVTIGASFTDPVTNTVTTAAVLLTLTAN